MRGLSVSDAAAIVGGELHGSDNSDSEILGVAIDSRKVEAGFMFAALKGERVDGHDYMNKAFELGAACCIAERVPENVTGTVIVVPNVAAALKTLAEHYRKRFDIPVIGIAGSVGKTTAKEMVASVLSRKYNVLKTEKNLNNELGVPLTIFRIEPEHEVAVIEMGISDFGEMSRLAKMVRPTMAVYTLIGHAHLERLHDRSGVLKAKTEMLDYMPDDSTLFLNGDDDLLSTLDCRQRKVLYGTCANADVKAENICSDRLNELSCDIVSGERRIHVTVPSYGSHMVYAALEGAAVGIEMGLTDDEISADIAAYETVGRRANVIDTGYITLVDDCYNANPDSVMCAIDSLKTINGRKVCILGDMLEMGENKEELHTQVGRYASDNGVDLLLTVGELSRYTCTAAEEISSLHFETNAELISKLPELIKKGDTVLVKASHSMKFDEISEALKLLK
ncbi:uDP-N-acetylmuramoyl-tripeptide--D-alanyl-D-alanine ligase [Firmicutes bacterium CAG:555]|nr:uDP-N-acetylmuramoyl-tripeptide--D-alanyl-D-alanine ligase [Firmicutes bacterium CAG:555]